MKFLHLRIHDRQTRFMFFVCRVMIKRTLGARTKLIRCDCSNISRTTQCRSEFDVPRSSDNDEENQGEENIPNMCLHSGLTSWSFFSFLFVATIEESNDLGKRKREDLLEKIERRKEPELETGHETRPARLILYDGPGEPEL